MTFALILFPARIFPRRTQFANQGEYSDGMRKAVVIVNSGALVFRNQMFGEIRADICGQCSHLELRIEGPEDLYEHYLKTMS